MIKRLAAIAAVTVGFSVSGVPAASAAECSGTQTLLGSCPAPQPSQPQPSQPSQPAQPAPGPGTIAEQPGGAARLLQLVNRERVAAGLPALEARGEITSIAGGHSRSMASRRSIWHNDAYFTAPTRQSLRAKGLGENVALNASVDDAHRRLMASPGHRANILNASFDAVGISVVHDESGTFYVTQNFVDSIAVAPVAPKPAPTPRAAPPAAAPRVQKQVAPAAPPATPAPEPQAEDAAPVELDAVLAAATSEEAPALAAGTPVWMAALAGVALVALLSAIVHVVAKR